VSFLGKNNQNRSIQIPPVALERAENIFYVACTRIYQSKKMPSHEHGHTHSHEHGHSHAGHHHHHVSAADAANSAFIAGIVLNSAYVIVQAVAGFMTNSMALLSDAGHNLSDVASLILSLLAFRLAKVKPTDSFTYGYKKTTILAALTNAVVLLVTIGMLGYESVNRLLHPVKVEGGIVAIVAGIGIAINLGSALLFFRNKDHDLNTKGAYLHLLTDALVSMGVVVAGIVIKYTNWYWLDGAVSITVLLVILVGTWSLLTDSLRLSLDAVPANVDLSKIEAVITKIAGVESLHHVHIWAMSTTENALTTHLVLNDKLTFDQKMKLVGKIKHELLHNNIQHATIELESADMPCEDADC
jgi:cobalt-zinc-cadmium efflux system protein